MMQHVVLIPLLSEGYVDKIIATLVRRDYIVESDLDGAPISRRKGSMGTVLALRVTLPPHRQRDDDESAMTDAVYRDVRTVLGEVGALYFGLIVVDSDAFRSYGPGNVPKSAEDLNIATWHQRLARDEEPGG